MFENKKANLIIGVVIYVAYIIGIRYVLDIYYNLLFWIVAFVYGSVGFWSVELSDAKGDSLKRHSRWALVLQIAAISCVLAAMYLNQHEIRHVPWYMHILVAFIGSVISGISFMMSDVSSSSSSSSSSYSSSSYGSSSSSSSGSSSARTSIRPSISISDFQSESRAVVVYTLEELLGVPKDEIQYHILLEELGMDDLDYLEIIMILDKFLISRTGYSFDNVPNKSIMSYKLRSFVELEEACAYRRCSVEQYVERALRMIHTVGDLMDIMAESIYCSFYAAGHTGIPYTDYGIQQFVLEQSKKIK